jgi:hypothetical protein
MKIAASDFSNGCAAVLFFGLMLAGTNQLTQAAPQTQPTSEPSLQAPYSIGPEIASDEFEKDFAKWETELERGGSVRLSDGALEINVPGGCTVWFKQRFDAPVLIQYEATVVRAGGANDRVSDSNCFWMARDSRSPDDLFATKRSGKFADYNPLKCYYVGLGGNGNTTTRFRRYIGDVQLRPLLPEHDLRDPADMITPNVSQTIRLLAADHLVQYYRDDKRLFELTDADPYTSGWFAIRTTQNHMLIRHFHVYRLVPR